jgi:hypothetical protein
MNAVPAFTKIIFEAFKKRISLPPKYNRFRVKRQNSKAIIAYAPIFDASTENP